MADNRIDRELAWDDFIENDSPDYVILPEGDYDFTVTGFERGRFNGSAKLPPCNKAVLSIKINTPEEETTITHNLFLHTKTEGLICAFFNSIGQRKKGEKLKMNWNKVIGSEGRCKVGVHTYTKKEGGEGTANDIQKFYPKEEAEQTPQTAAPVHSYQAGKF